MALFAKAERTVPEQRRKQDGAEIVVPAFKLVATFNADDWTWSVAVVPKNHARAEIAAEGTRDLLQRLTDEIPPGSFGPALGSPSGAAMARALDLLGNDWKITQPLPTAGKDPKGEEVEY